MKKKSFLSICIIAILFAGCAKDYHTTLENDNSGKFGSLQVKISSYMENVNLTIDDKLVAENKHTDRIIVNNVPVGTHNLLITTSGISRKDLKKEKEFTIKPGQENTQLIEATNKTIGSYFLAIGVPIVAFIVSYSLL